MDGGSVSQVVVCIDVDCFFVQVERKRHPELVGVPIVIQQHADIIAVDYEARSLGVRKHDAPSDVLRKFPHVALVHVYEVDGRVSYIPYRAASRQMFDLLRDLKLGVVEKGSPDEGYVDVTEEVKRRASRRVTSLVRTKSNSDNESDGEAFPSANSSFSCDYLQIGAEICSEIRHALKQQLDFSTSGGIAHNKLLAKLASGHNKPNGQTVLRPEMVPYFMSQLTARKLPGFGSKAGRQLSDRGVIQASDALRYTEAELVAWLGEKSGPLLYRSCRGIDHSIVMDKGPPRSIVAQMSLYPIACSDTEPLLKITRSLCNDIAERVLCDHEEYGRVPRSLIVLWRLQGQVDTSKSLSMPHIRDGVASDLYDCVSHLLALTVFAHTTGHCTRLALTAANFTAATTTTTTASGSVSCNSIDALWKRNTMATQSRGVLNSTTLSSQQDAAAAGASDCVSVVADDRSQFSTGSGAATRSSFASVMSVSRSQPLVSPKRRRVPLSTSAVSPRRSNAADATGVVNNGLAVSTQDSNLEWPSTADSRQPQRFLCEEDCTTVILPTDGRRCEQCGTVVPQMESAVQQHLDWHVAQRLEAELNGRPVSDRSSAIVKRSRSKPTAAATASRKQARTIDSFFVRK